MSPIEFLINYTVGILPFGVLLLKARGKMFLLCVLLSILLALLPIVSLVPAIVMSFRLGKPNSWWAHRFYGWEKTSGARARFQDSPDERANGLAACGWTVLAPCRSERA